MLPSSMSRSLEQTPASAVGVENLPRYFDQSPTSSDPQQLPPRAPMYNMNPHGTEDPSTSPPTLASVPAPTPKSHVAQKSCKVAQHKTSDWLFFFEKTDGCWPPGDIGRNVFVPSAPHSYERPFRNTTAQNLPLCSCLLIHTVLPHPAFVYYDVPLPLVPWRRIVSHRIAALLTGLGICRVWMSLISLLYIVDNFLGRWEQ